MNKQTFENKISRHLSACGLQFDVIESYGCQISFKVRQGRERFTPKQYAWMLLEALPDSEVFDILPEVHSWDGHCYLVVRVNVNHIPTQPVSVGPNGTGRVQRPRSIPSPQPPKQATEKLEQVQLPGRFLSVGSFADLKLEPVTGAVAYTVIPKKKDGQLKQARCQLVVADGRVNAQVTKTGQVVENVPLTRLFDHVPHLVEDRWV